MDSMFDQRIIARLKPRQVRIALLSLLAVLLALYAIRFINQVQIGVSHDDAEYMILAESFATGQPYRLVNHPDAPLETTWPPGYPLFVLTVPWMLFGPNYTLLRALNVILALVAGLCSYGLLKQYFSRATALFIAGLFLLNPQVIKWSTIAMSDIPFAAFSLAFWLSFSHWRRQRGAAYHWLFASAVLLTLATLTRYWGVAFFGAAWLMLLWERRWRQAMAFALAYAVLLLPFILFLVGQEAVNADRFYAYQSLARDLAGHLRNVLISLVTYWRTIPLVLVPLLGSQVSTALDSIGLAWVIDVVHTFILGTVAIGFVYALRKRRLLALAAGGYLAVLLVLTQHYQESTLIFDEPRYLVPILLFLYVFLLDGVRVLMAWRSSPVRTQYAVQLVGAALVLILVGRNVQQATTQFPVADISSGADWAKANTQPDDIFMTVDAIDRYLHLQRRTLFFPDNAADFWYDVAHYQVKYLLIAQSLRTADNSWIANMNQQPDTNLESVIRPAIRAQPECFTPVYNDEPTNTEIYRVELNCPALQLPATAP